MVKFVCWLMRQARVEGGIHVSATVRPTTAANYLQTGRRHADRTTPGILDVCHHKLTGVSTHLPELSRRSTVCLKKTGPLRSI